MDSDGDIEMSRIPPMDTELGIPLSDSEEEDFGYGNSYSTEAVSQQPDYLKDLSNHPRFAKAELEEATLEQLSVHQHFVSKDSIYESRLPIFDDCTIYGMVAKTEEMAHEKQLEYFMEYLSQGPEIERPHLFEKDNDSNNIPRTIPDLEAVAELISCNLDICLYDSAIHVVDQLFPHQEETTSAEWLVNVATTVARSSSRVLKDRYVGSPQVQPRLPPAQKNETLTKYCYPDLIDYICTSMIRLMSRSISGLSCLSTFIAILVRLSVKLKHLVRDPARCAGKSLSNGRSIAFRLESAGAKSRWRKETSYKKILFTMVDSGPEQSGSSRYSGSGLRRLIEHSTPPTRYYKMHFLLRLEFANMMRALLASLVSNSTVDNRITTKLRLKTTLPESASSQDGSHADGEHFGFANVIQGNRIDRPFLFRTRHPVLRVS